MAALTWLAMSRSGWKTFRSHTQAVWLRLRPWVQIAEFYGAGHGFTQMNLLDVVFGAVRCQLFLGMNWLAVRAFDARRVKEI